MIQLVVECRMMKLKQKTTVPMVPEFIDTLRITRSFIEAELSHYNEHLSFGLISQQKILMEWLLLLNLRIVTLHSLFPHRP